MPTTPVYGFPYPAGTDRVMDGDNAMGALALAVEATVQPSVDGLKRAVPLIKGQSGDQTLTNTLANLAGTALTWTAVVPETVLFIACFDFSISAADPGVCTGQIMLDGALVAYARFYLGATGLGRATVLAVGTSPVAAGARTVLLQAAKANATGGVSAVASGTRIIALRIPT